MSDNSAIEWTGATLNVVTGCTRVSEGCRHCYIERTPPFRMAGRRFDSPEIGGATGVVLHPDRLALPLKWRKPRRIFVNSLADLFHEDVPDEFIARLFAVMAGTPQHTYQILTKRPARMRTLIGGFYGSTNLIAAAADKDAALALYMADWPLPNVWLGVSVENQQWADIRIPALLNTPAAVRWISAEPLLGPIDLKQAVIPMGDQRGHGLTASYVHTGDCCRRLHGLDWMVAGGESGPGARPAHPDWFRSLRDQCQGSEVAFFLKQWGAYAPHGEVQETTARTSSPLVLIDPQGRTHSPKLGALAPAGSVLMARYGKHRAGRLLDGHAWDEYPAVTA